ncbi:YraN family protein [Nocardia suismassiliense]|uniref:YraN family protein n=1 Tax=Nocardia suismassiliense TaxID=2077092 RepID=UPI000D1FC1E7|nr:YraN family protein [Nocardia suismassiliense]
MDETITGTEVAQDSASFGGPTSADGTTAPAEGTDVDLAAEFLRRQGFTIVATSWICRYGVLDVIAQDKGYTVFVRVADASLPPRCWPFAMHQRLRRLALLWLAEQHDPVWQLRFDAITVDRPEDQAPVLTHHLAVC